MIGGVVAHKTCGVHIDRIVLGVFGLGDLLVLVAVLKLRTINRPMP